MALFLPGMRCRLCGDSIKRGEDAELFPFFTGNEADALFVFSDAVTHKTCFEQDKRHDFVSARVQEFSAFQERRPRICEVCGLQVVSPDDFLGFGYLTDNPESGLYRWNYAQLHRSCLPQWVELKNVIELGNRETQSGRWKGKGMEQFLSELRRAVPVNPNGQATPSDAGAPA